MISSENYQISTPINNNGSLPVETEPLSIDEIIDRALNVCRNLPDSCRVSVNNIEELRHRLAHGRLHLAVLGQFNRGKSTFINALVGFNVLPTSVLPLTSVPTLISWGPHLKCVVRFLNGKGDLVVQTSNEDISATLITYVAEEHNPKNQLCVKEVEVQCPSVLLENGTVLIDTPGFGSTYLHNTRTALETIVECDAALFLISADPPLTQMEVEFLKQVQNRVSRIFFILNKIDLLSEPDLREVDRFIRGTLISRMGYEVDLRLFHICAIKGLNAERQHVDDRDWIGSGMDTIRSGVLDFMTREKYFALSQALNEKLGDALREITNTLKQQIEDFHKPVETMHKEHEGFVAGADTIRKAIDKELALVEIEKKAILKFLDEQSRQADSTIQSALTVSIGTLFSNSAGVLKTIDNLTSALNRMVLQTLTMQRTATINRVNRPYRKAIQVHLRELAKIHEMVIDCVGEIPDSVMSSVQDKLDLSEVDAEESWNFSKSISSKDIISEWTDWFQNRQTRIARIRNRVEKLAGEMIAVNKKEYFTDLSIQYKNAFDKMRSVLSDTYSELLKCVDEISSKKERSLTSRKLESDPSVRALKNHVSAIENIISLLK
ncbi:MAG: dynamin family protein [Chitinispirillaceae bacterium]|nr:dynamin family protein [Chitinispirillaceae bacterium]